MLASVDESGRLELIPRKIDAQNVTYGEHREATASRPHLDFVFGMAKAPPLSPGNDGAFESFRSVHLEDQRT